MNPPITPGEILLEEYLQPMGISQNAMSRAIGVAIPGTLCTSSALKSSSRAITPAMSIRFGDFFGPRRVINRYRPDPVSLAGYNVDMNKVI